ncbi:ABC transporter substrate-binding protein [Aeromicrobium sp. Leaf350]|uniref:ABC transporter substrate-binding protein n=1 Tax=Aeromicrobium sp. Leaf350 TaxID=2876565 RepID=UPI001E2E2777|nr:ABC transporter substrate-binding protein [Aeromicrobium sp. Leaf350]
MKRRVALPLVTGLVLAVLTACGSSDEGPTGPTIAVEHKFGTTQVPEDAERVVTVGYNDQDFVLALGVVPVATRDWFEEYSDYPWVTEVTGGEEIPVLAGDDVNFEDVAAQEPDVIFAIYDSIDQKTYDRLSDIAPTVVQSAEFEDEETPWDEQLRLTAQALGKGAEAEALIAEVDAKVAEVAQAHPEFAGQVLTMDYGPEDGGHYAIGAGDPRRTVFDLLGFAAQDAVGDVSEERLDVLDQDVLFVLGATQEEMLESPVFSRLAVVQEGRTMYATWESTLTGALSYSGPNALLWAIDELVPELAAATAPA